MEDSQRRKLSSPARRHFLALSARAAGKIAAAAAVVSAALPSSAEADRHGWGWGRHHGRPGCFLKGTRILTVQGEVCVEDIRIGDLVVTMRGVALPVKWVGRNSYQTSGARWLNSVMPIRVSRFAIDDSSPYADLYLSPGHALYIDGFLMPVGDFVNGISIAPVASSQIECIDYYQIVLATHEVIWAEGAAVETFVANSAREFEMFANFAEYKRLYPKGVTRMTPFAPNLGTGWAHLRALAGAGISCFSNKRNPAGQAYERLAARAYVAYRGEACRQTPVAF